MSRRYWTAVLAIACAGASSAGSAVIGRSEAAESLTVQRIAMLPAADREPWLAYLHRSDAAKATDHAAMRAEREGLAAIPPEPETSSSAQSIPLDRALNWYMSAEARHIADVIVSFQTPSGGWGKNINLAGVPRQRGQSYVSNNLNKFASPGDFDAPQDPAWHYVGTLDNDATTTEMHFLAKVQANLPGVQGDVYRTSFVRGVRYLLASQYPNGGWPQVWPLDGGYHDAITFNDDAEVHAAEVLDEVAVGKPEVRFVPQVVRVEAGGAAERALRCMLATQIVLHGRRTIWGQQHDMLTLQPVAARNFEPAALATSESARVLEYLMSLPAPSPEVRKAVTAGVAWLRTHAIYGEAVVGGRATPEGRHVVAQPGAGPLWARFYSLDAEKAIFGDRDKTIHDDMNEISPERRNGYGWFNTEPSRLIDTYNLWVVRRPER